MNTVLVSLVSEQTIPNILAIHHFNPDELLFITTKEMEEKKKVEAILNTLSDLNLGYHDRSNRIIVLEDSILDCHRKIEQWINGKENSEFIVNLTGGTKIMSISAHEFFKDYSSKMIYIPIPKNEFIVPFPKKSPGKPIELKLRLSVSQYLNAYGLNVIQKEKLDTYQREAIQRRDLSAWMVTHYERVKNLLIWFSIHLRGHRSDKQFPLSQPYNMATEEEKELLRKLDFKDEEGKISKTLTRSEIKYLTGGWLEEFCFNEVFDLVSHGIDHCVIGLRLKNAQGRDNEFDVMFTKENELYFIECKSLDQKEDKETDILYKIGALQKEFGLRVKSFLVTTSSSVIKDNQLVPSIRERAEQFKTSIIHSHQVKDFKKVISKQLKIEGIENDRN